ncbi:hypothetical protein LDENG_00173560 [Lucifuga dentata]|nr:hypothetical protein LDENG_00173560 [Lucifuga dentata]
MGPPAGQRPKTHIRKHPGTVQNKTLDCSKVAAMRPGLNPSEHLERSENSSWKRHPSNLERTEQLSKEEWPNCSREVQESD